MQALSQLTLHVGGTQQSSNLSNRLAEVTLKLHESCNQTPQNEPPTAESNPKDRLSLEEKKQDAQRTAIEKTIQWLRDNRYKLPFRISLWVKEKIYQQLDNKTKDTSDAYETCQEFALQLFNHQHPFKNRVFIPSFWIDPASQKTFLYEAFPSLLPKQQPHVIVIDQDNNISCEAQSDNCIAFSLRSSGYSPSFFKSGASRDKSILSLAHLLVAHIEPYPNSEITIQENCSYREELTLCLYAYQSVYQVLGSTLKFTFKDTATPPHPNLIQGKIKEIIDFQIPCFQDLNFDALHHLQAFQKPSLLPSPIPNDS